MQAPQHQMNVALFTCLPGGPEDPKETQRYVDLDRPELRCIKKLLNEYNGEKTHALGGWDIYLSGMGEVEEFAKDCLSDMSISNFRLWALLYLKCHVSNNKKDYGGNPKSGSDYFEAADNGRLDDEVSGSLSTFLSDWFYNKGTLRKFYLSPEEVAAHKANGGTFNVEAVFSLDLGWWGGQEEEEQWDAESSLEEEAAEAAEPPYSPFDVKSPFADFEKSSRKAFKRSLGA